MTMHGTLSIEQRVALLTTEELETRRRKFVDLWRTFPGHGPRVEVVGGPLDGAHAPAGSDGMLIGCCYESGRGGVQALYRFDATEARYFFHAFVSG